MAGRLANITGYEAKKGQRKADAMPAAVPPLQGTITPQSQQVREGFQQMGQMNPQQPVLEKWDLDKMAESQRNNYMQSFDTWAEAEKRGDISQRDWANARIQKMIAEGKNPGQYENMLSMMGDAETPEEKRKRERREQLGEVFNNLGNLIGNAANLYYTHRGGQYIDLNTANEKHRERMDRLKEKQDALLERQKNILINAKLGDIKTQQAERAAERKAERDAAADALKNKREMAKLAIQHAYNLGEIDAKTAAELVKSANKAKSDKELETLRQKNRVALKGMPTYGESKVVDSAIGADGNIYTRNSKLTDNEAMQIVQSSVPADELAPFVTTDDEGNQKTDWRAAAAYAFQKGYISAEELEQMGFKKGKTSKKKGNSLGLGIGNNNNNGNKLGIGL